MGMYDTFGKEGIQLKNGLCEMDHYSEGDQVPGLTDGIYIGLEGAVVIRRGRVVCTFPIEFVYNKWGANVSIAEQNPLIPIIEKIREEQQNGKSQVRTSKRRRSHLNRKSH
jgi:hypothetical protein